MVVEGVEDGRGDEAWFGETGWYVYSWKGLEGWRLEFWEAMRLERTWGICYILGREESRALARQEENDQRLRIEARKPSMQPSRLIHHKARPGFHSVQGLLSTYETAVWS